MAAVNSLRRSRSGIGGFTVVWIFTLDRPLPSSSILTVNDVRQLVRHPFDARKSVVIERPFDDASIFEDCLEGCAFHGFKVVVVMVQLNPPRRFLHTPHRQTRQLRGHARGFNEGVICAFDRERAGAGEGDIAAIQCDGAVAGVERDALIRLDFNAPVDAEHAHRLIGEHLHGLQMRMNRHRAVRGDDLDAAGMAVEARRLAAGGGQGLYRA